MDNDPILIVDADPGRAFALQAALLELGREVTVVLTVENAARQLEARSFALVLLDDALADAMRPNTGVIVLSTSMSHSRTLELYARGVLDVIPAALAPSVLRAKVSVHLAEPGAVARAIAADTARLAMEDRQSELIGVLAHELRNPINALALSAVVLRSVPQVPGDLVDRMDRALAMARRLIDDAYELSRMRGSQLDLRDEYFDLRRAVEDAIDLMQYALEEKTHTLEVRKTELELCILGDRMRTAQLVANLLGNAARYTARGGAIRVDVARVGAEGVVEVLDNGRGMAPTVLPHIFEPRVQSREGEGLGLGLYIAKHIAARHGGSIEAFSEGIGRGSRFTVRYPLARCAECALVPE